MKIFFEISISSKVSNVYISLQFSSSSLVTFPPTYPLNFLNLFRLIAVQAPPGPQSDDTFVKIIIESAGGNAKVVVPDIPASNGVIHIIDNVL